MHNWAKKRQQELRQFQIYSNIYLYHAVYTSFCILRQDAVSFPEFNTSRPMIGS